MTDQDPFAVWRQFSQEIDPFSASECVAGSSSPLPSIPAFQLTDEERRAYDAPFVDDTYAAGARQFPVLVPTSGVHPSAHLCRDIWTLLADCHVPLTTAFGDNDPVTGPLQGLISNSVPGAANQPHTIVEGAGPFLQEHQPERCVAASLGLRLLLQAPHIHRGVFSFRGTSYEYALFRSNSYKSLFHSTSL